MGDSDEPEPRPFFPQAATSGVGLTGTPVAMKASHRAARVDLDQRIPRGIRLNNARLQALLSRRTASFLRPWVAWTREQRRDGEAIFLK
jgi:hypothetical protein